MPYSFSLSLCFSTACLTLDPRQGPHVVVVWRVFVSFLCSCPCHLSPLCCLQEATWFTPWLVQQIEAPLASDGLLRAQYFLQISSEPRGWINSASCFGGDHLRRGGVLPRQEGPGVQLCLSPRAHGQGCVLFTPCLRVMLSSVLCLALPFLSNISTCLILHTVVCLILCACGGYINGIVL